jgi:hypothetical protein
MCFGEVNLRAICVDYYEKIYTTSKKKLLEFETLEFIKINDNNIIKITELGKPMMRLIDSCFDYYLENHFLHAKIV